MRNSRLIALPLIAAGLLAATVSQAASVYLTPASSTLSLASGSTSFDLYMDFTGTPTVGGGIDLDLTGPIAIGTFTPTAYFTASTDPAFTGYGTANADADFEIHFGNFAGLSGVNKLGSLTVSLAGLGTGSIALAINQTFGAFYGTDSLEQSVTLSGAEVNVVPLPATAWMLLTGIGALVGRKLRR